MKQYGASVLNWQNLDEILTFFLTAFLTFVWYTEIIRKANLPEKSIAEAAEGEKVWNIFYRQTD